MTLLASMDEDGFCQFASIGNIAQAAIVTRQEASEAISTLETPDPDSSDPDNEGRRIQRVPGGWMVLNAAKYRELAKREQAKEQTRERVRKFRSGDGKVTGGDIPVTPCNASVTRRNADETSGNEKVTLSEAYTYTEAKNQNLSLATLTEKHGHIPLAGPVYDNYPRHEGRAAAIKTITKKIKSLARQGWVEFVDRHGQLTRVPIENEVAAAAFLQESALEFGRSPAGMKGEFVPHPATWFNQERFTDDRQQWYRENSNGNSHKSERAARARAIAEQLANETDGETEQAIPEHPRR